MVYTQITFEDGMVFRNYGTVTRTGPNHIRFIGDGTFEKQVCLRSVQRPVRARTAILTTGRFVNLPTGVLELTSAVIIYFNSPLDNQGTVRSVSTVSNSGRSISGTQSIKSLAPR